MEKFESLHCKWLDHFVIKDMALMWHIERGKEILKWRVLYWKNTWKQGIEDCDKCKPLIKMSPELKELWDSEKEVEKQLKVARKEKVSKTWTIAKN